MSKQSFASWAWPALLVLGGCGGSASQTPVQTGAPSDEVVVGTLTRDALNDALCGTAVEAERASTCVVDQLTHVGSTSDGRPLYVARSLPYGECEDRPYCKSLPEATPAEGAEGLAGIGGDYESDDERSQQLGLAEGCVPTYYWRVIVESNSTLTTRKLANICTPMSAGGSVDSISLEGTRFIVARQNASTWTTRQVEVAELFPLRLVSEASSTMSRTSHGARSVEWHHEHGTGVAEANPLSCEDQTTHSVVIPNATSEIDFARLSGLGACSATLMTRPAQPADAPLDPNAPHLLVAGNSVYIEMAEAHDFDLLLTKQVGDGQDPGEGAPCASEVEVQSIHYTVSRGGAVAAGESTEGAPQTRPSGRVLPNRRILARVEIPIPRGTPAEVGNPFLPNRVFVRVGDYQSWNASRAGAAPAADLPPTVYESSSRNVTCSMQGGELAIDPPRLLEECGDCLLGARN